MLVGPERGKQQELAFFRRDLHRLVAELGLAARPFDIVEIPDRDELAVAHLVAAAVDVPVVELAGEGALHRVSDVLEASAEERMAPGQGIERRHERPKERVVEVLPVRLPAHDEVRRAFDRRIEGRPMSDPSRVVLRRAGLEAAHHLAADLARQRTRKDEEEAAGDDFVQVRRRRLARVPGHDYTRPRSVNPRQTSCRAPPRNGPVRRATP